MMKFLKGSFYFSLLLTAVFGLFHLYEYATGGPFVAYLQANSEVKPLDDAFDYGIMAEDIAANDLILVGEIHGFDAPAKFDVDFFRYLHGEYGVRTYFAELDYLQAKEMNDYLTSGEEAFLQKALRKWAVIQGRDNQDYLEKYRALHKFHAALPAADKFRIEGVDRITDWRLLINFLNPLVLPADSMHMLPMSVDDLPVNALALIERLQPAYSENGDTALALQMLLADLEARRDSLNRDARMAANFTRLFRYRELAGQKCYGFFGLGHVFQYRVNGSDPMASLLRQSDLGLGGKILSANFIMNDSEMTMKSDQLPGFLADDGPYTALDVSADDFLFMYLFGVKDLKRVTPKYHKAIIKLDGPDNPYANSGRLQSTFRLVPVQPKTVMDEPGKVYAQYMIFVRNSPWAEPVARE